MCIACSGALADEAALRQSIGLRELDRLWRRIGLGDDAEIDCPMCGERMLAAIVDGVTLDGCPDHDVIWFDGAELSRFRSGLDTPDTSRLVHFLYDFPL